VHHVEAELRESGKAYGSEIGHREANGLKLRELVEALRAQPNIDFEKLWGTLPVEASELLEALDQMGLSESSCQKPMANQGKAGSRFCHPG
jgi:hypothetical protein